MSRDHLLITFTRRSEAIDALERAKAHFGERAPIRLADAEDSLDSLHLGQRAEISESLLVPGPGVVSGPLARGAVLWGALGFVVGAVVASPIGLLIDTPSEMPQWQMVAFVGLAGAFAVSVVAFVLGGARQAVKEGETTPADPTAVLRVDTDRDRADEFVEFFGSVRGRDAYFVDRPVERAATGEVERPRPLVTDPGVTAGANSDQDAGFRSDVE